MNWSQAVEAMRAGNSVRRQSDSWTRVVQESTGPDIAGASIHETGEEGCRLMHAWTPDDKPALVFMGSMSRCLFVPDDEHRGATDWEIEK